MRMTTISLPRADGSHEPRIDDQVDPLTGRQVQGQTGRTPSRVGGAHDVAAWRECVIRERCEQRLLRHGDQAPALLAQGLQNELQRRRAPARSSNLHREAPFAAELGGVAAVVVLAQELLVVDRLELVTPEPRPLQL